MKDFIIPYEGLGLDGRDMGTPAARSDKLVTLSIDGFAVTVPEGTSVLRAAAKVGIEIPKLCATDTLDAFGSCRLCLVEIDDRRGTPASCTTQVSENMVVHTSTERIDRIRKGVIELYASDHPAIGIGDPANGDSELQKMAARVGLREVRYEPGANHIHTLNPDGGENARHDGGVDTSNPYFSYDPEKCILCSLCIRACDDIQGTFALTMEGRGFETRMSAGGIDDNYLTSDCVSCGACVQVCPTGSLQEHAVIEIGLPDREVITTCAYCGVGCNFKAEMRGDELVRMVPWKNGKANLGHSCIKGRFAWGYANHGDRVLNPMIRDKITDPWREVSWDEALSEAASRLSAVQKKYGRTSIGGLTSSRCTNEETYLVQKMIRSVFGNNNTDTCARVCHSPTGYGLGQAFGTSAGTQDFDSADETDVFIVMGANPTDAHPVFGSRIKQRMRAGAKMIVIDPRRIDLVKSTGIEADYHLALRPGTNVAVVSALAHVIVTEGLIDEDFIRTRCDWDEFQHYAEFIADPRHAPEQMEDLTGVPAETIRGAARLYARGGNAAIYYGLGVTEHSQGSTAVMGIANLAMMTGNIGRPGVGVNPLRGQNNVQGSCDMGSFPHELPGYRHISEDATREVFEKMWGTVLDNEPGLRVGNMLDAAVDGTFKGIYIQGEDIMQSDPDTRHVAAGLESMECVVVQDLFLNSTADFAHIFLPGSTFLEKDGTFTNTERRINRVRRVMAPKAGYADWETTQLLANKMGAGWNYTHPSQIMDEVAATTPSFAGVSFDVLDQHGSVQWPCNEAAPEGTPIMHVDGFVRGKGRFLITEYIPTDEKTGPRFPLLLTTGRTLTQYNVGTQTQRTDNTVWADEDLLEIHPHDAEVRGVRDGTYVRLASRMGETTMRALVTDRVSPGVVYTTFHHVGNQTNVVTTDYSDWATNCPEYKVTAVQISPSNGPSEWQKTQAERARIARRILPAAE